MCKYTVSLASLINILLFKHVYANFNFSLFYTIGKNKETKLSYQGKFMGDHSIWWESGSKSQRREQLVSTGNKESNVLNKLLNACQRMNSNQTKCNHNSSKKIFFRLVKLLNFSKLDKIFCLQTLQ